CGGSLEITEGMTVCECEYCGTMQTLPKTDNEQNLNMINRANHFRQQCEFDKAMEIYERILKNSEDAEIYWSIVLCRYGIEYVDDPLTKKKIPTCHRTQYKSILNDVDYLEALSHADTVQRDVFESEAKYIDTVQKGILEISNKEEPFDVFICYKETDANGRRTQDSVLAQDLYYQLTREGFKVFFSRITLEDKLGTEYEPYIFAALNSSKVMVVVGTKPEYFDAVWVKNEWSRYLMMMQEDHSKTIIPAYRDMDPYDLPDALSMYQAQDMSKLGFMQDLIRGIGKIAKTEPEREVVHQQTIVQTAASGNIENLLKRGNLALEDGDWTAAGNFFEQVLNENVEEARAYLGLLMVDLKVPSEEVLVNTKTNFGGNANFIKAKRFGDDSFKEKMDNLLLEADYSYAVKRFNSAVNDTEIEGARKLLEKLGNYKDSAEKAKQCEEKKNEYFYQIAVKSMESSRNDADYNRSRELFEKIGGYKDSAEKAELCTEKGKEYLYKAACSEMDHANVESAYKRAAELFKKMNGYRDSKAKAQECLGKAEESRKQVIYEQALDKKKNNTIESQEDAIKLFESIEGFVDSDKQIEECRQQIEKIKQAQAKAEKKAKARKRKIRMIAIVSAIVVVIGTAGTIVTTKVILPEMKYNSAVEELNKGNYDAAITKFSELGEYKDSEDMEKESRYQNAISLYENGIYADAVAAFKELGDYKDTESYIANNEMKKEIFKSAQINEVVPFGKYDWYVIEKNSDGCTLLCADAVCDKQYNSKLKNTTWELCTLRKWLNRSFYDEFTAEEKTMIVKTTCINNDSSENGTNGGENTEDYIYLLSIDEAKKVDESILKCSAGWWLRSPGCDQKHTAECYYDGSVGMSGRRVDGVSGVRPALKIKF
ncbi:MAG: DUF6273 domain-containing protein, partial [Ruminococcus sp.]